MARVLVPTKYMTRDLWLQYRQRGIGGSDAAAIVGLNPYASAYTIWADKTGRLPEREETEAMRQGRDLEGYVAERFEEKSGMKVRRKNAILQHDEHDFILANIDREIIGQRAGLECKTTSVMNLKRFKNGEFPDQYYAQCVHYMAVTGYPTWYLAVLVLNQDFMVYAITTDAGLKKPEWCESLVYVEDDEIKSLIEQETLFWQKYVTTDTAPPVDGERPTTDALTTIYAESDAGTVDLFGREKALDCYFELSDEIYALEREQERIRQQLMEDMGESEIGRAGVYKVTWKPQKRTTIDGKAVLAAHPEINAEPFTKTSEFRRFAIKKEEK